MGSTIVTPPRRDGRRGGSDLSGPQRGLNFSVAAPCAVRAIPCRTHLSCHQVPLVSACGRTEVNRAVGTTMSELTGWQPDPYGSHEFRFFSADGKATLLVMDGGNASYDKPPMNGRPPSERSSAKPSPAAADQEAHPLAPTSPPPAFDGLPRADPGRGPEPVAGIPETLLPYQDRATAGLEQWSVIPQPAGHKGRSGGEQRSPQRLSRPRKIALRIVIAVLAVSLLALGYVHRPRSSPGRPALAAAAKSTTTAVAPPLTSTTTQALPTALQPSADAAANALVSNWAAGNRAGALTVATEPAVVALFAAPFASGLAIDRGCSSTFQPIICTFGPPGGASPTDPSYEISVTQAAGGWYVSSLKIEN